MRFRSRLRFIALVGVFGALASCLGVHGSPVQSSKIVFTSNRFSLQPPAPSKWQIYIMDLDGTDVRRLTNLPDSTIMPTLSPDGHMVAFTVYHQHPGRLGGDARSIYLIDADGSHLHRLTIPPMSGEDPAFSPDNRRIVFMGWNDGSGPASIHIIDVDGTHLIDTGQVGMTPSFSPDGRKILFTCRANPTQFDQVCVMDQDGSHVRTLTSGFAPRFSLDGHLIAFASRREVGGIIWQWALIYVMDADGSSVRLIEDPSSSGTDPSFTPDGHVLFAKWHVYQGPPNAPHAPEFVGMQICVMNSDGTREHCLTSGSWENGWRPFF